MFDPLLTGILIGFAVAAPVGPIALLIMRRSLNEGRLCGFVSGLGAATADLLCGLVAALGVSALTALISTHHRALQLVGGLVMLVLGWNAFRAKDPSAAKRPLHERNLFIAYLFTFLLTLSNPLTLFGMIAVIAAFRAGGPNYTRFDMIVLGGGIFVGSACWWFLLCNFAGWLGRRLGPRLLHVLNMTAGVIIFAFGAWQLGSLAQLYLTR
jgi:threonine/homoserine/homoserine lactone efflux protein